jgi:hypothetical protein
MWTGISEDLAHIAPVSVARRWIFTCWLALTVAAAVGGWFSGRSWIVVEKPPAEATMSPLSRRNEAVLAPDSPKGQWTRRVQEATPADFPRLLVEWRTLFPETENGIEGQPEHALRWLLAQWLVNDREGLVKLVWDDGFDGSYYAAQVIAKLNPELAVDLLGKMGALRANQFFVNILASELAKNQPALYLKLDPDGTKDFTPGDSMWENSWELSIHSLAGTDPMAAANAWKKRKLENNDDQVLQSLVPAFVAWREGDPPIKDWVGQIEDPEIRELAQHARLMTLARKDPHAALSELYSTPLQKNNDLREDGPHEVLAQLAKQDFPAALRLLKETSPLFHPSDPFSEPSDEASKPRGNPFISHANMGDTPEDNWMRSVIVREAAGHLPENPDDMIAALHQLRTQMGGDSPWQRKIEAELIRIACENHSTDYCLATARLWDAVLGGGRDDETFQSLAARTVATDPDRAEAALDSLPEATRASFAAEIVKRLPPEETGRRLALLDRLTPAQWDEKLGAKLGENAADYADAIAALPGDTTQGARAAFMEKWAQNDPDAAIRWFDTLPMDDAAGPAALGLFKGWVDYDKAAAVAWAETLPNGQARQAVALEVVHEIAGNSPREAWRWAASITDPKVRAWAYNTISVGRDDEPETFRKEHEAVLRAAGMK